VRVFAAIGVRVMVVTNASGGVNPEYRIEDVMVITDHLSFPGLSGINPLIGENDVRFGPRFPAVSPVYHPDLQAVAVAAAGRVGMSAKLRKGTYVGVSGPTYETPAEIGAMRILGGDAVGMVRHTHTYIHTHLFVY
jgi:purine-nucleoside phosphorylase